jgi:hypothetical protein
MFNNTKNTIAASEMITNLEKSGKIGSKGAVEKIKKAIAEYNQSNEILIIALMLKSKNLKVEGKKEFQEEYPIENNDYALTYKNVIEKLKFTGKKEEDVNKLKKNLLDEKVVSDIVKNKHLVLEDEKPYMEVLIKENRYLDFGKFWLDLAK